MSDVPGRLLREALRGRTPTPPAPDCLDAATLAAWADGALSARERAAAERHASSCARCQALVAAMARTAPPLARTWRHASAIKWIAPLAVAAAAAVVWVVVAPRQPRPAAARAQAAAAAASPSSVDAKKPAASTSAELASEQSLQAKSDQQRGATGRADAARAPRLPAEQTNIAPAPAPLVARDAAAAPPPPVAPLPPAAAAEETVPQTFAQTSAPAPQARFLGERARALAKALDVPVQILSPDPNSRWRIVASGVERSTDGGLTWQPQSTGVATPLTAGSAPSPAVCWLVGPGGLVLLSTDGAAWQRASLPEAIDLQSVRASDAANATVTSADGRRFATTDGGKSWRRVN